MSPVSPTDTEAEELRESVAPGRDSEGSNSSSDLSKSHTFSAVLKKKPSLAQIITRVRSASGVSTDSNGSTETARPRESTELPTKSPSNPMAPDSLSTKSQHSRDVAPWDRTVDVVYHKLPRGALRPDNSLDFERSVDLFLREHGRKRIPRPKGYLALPVALRLRIWERVMEVDSNDRPVALTIDRWNKDAWRQGEFLTLRQALGDIQHCLEVSFEFRADALVSFLMTKRFHITYSPCIRPLLNPLATKWVGKYSPYMQNVALEIVLTEYRFGMNPSAHLLAPATTNLEKLIENFVEAQLRRRSVSTLMSLVVLCRRFYGRRRAHARLQNAELSGDECMYCPNKYLTICDPIKELRGLVDSTRLCGFSQPYTFSLIQSLFPLPSTDELKLHSYDIAPSTMWPQIEGQEAHVDEGNGRVKLQECTELPDGQGESPWGAIQLPAPVGSERGTDWMEKQIWLRQVTVQK